MRACRFGNKVLRLRRVSTISGGPSSLPFSLISGLPEISTQSVEVGKCRLRCGRRVPRASPSTRAPNPRPRSHAGVTNEGQRSAARRVGLSSASIEPGCGAGRLSHCPHAPWRSACRRFLSPGRAYRVEGQPPPRALDASSPHRVVAPSGMGRRRDAMRPFQRAPRTGAVVPPGRCPEASRVRGANPPAGAAPIPTNGLPSGWLPLGDEVMAD